MVDNFVGELSLISVSAILLVAVSSGWFYHIECLVLDSAHIGFLSAYSFA